MAKKFRVPAKKMAGGALVGDAPMQIGDAIRWAMNNPAEASKLLGLDKYASGRGIASSLSKAVAGVPSGSREASFKAMEDLRNRVMTDPRLHSDKVKDAATAAAGPFMSQDFRGQLQAQQGPPPQPPSPPTAPPPPTPQRPPSAPGMPMPPQQAAQGINMGPGVSGLPGYQPSLSLTPQAPMPAPQMPGPSMEEMAGIAGGADRASLSALAAPQPLPMPYPTAPMSVDDALTDKFMPQNGKEGIDWKKMLMYAGLAGLIGKTGIGTAGAGIMGGLIPLAGALLEKRGKKKAATKTEKTEKSAKGGQVMAKKSKKFGGASAKSAPKFAKKAPAMPQMPPPMTHPMAAEVPMKCGGKVKKMATGGLVSRGMGAATKGGKFKSC